MFRFFIEYQFSVLLKLKYFVFQVKYGEIKKGKNSGTIDSFQRSCIQRIKT